LQVSTDVAAAACADANLQSDPDIRRLVSAGTCTTAVMPVGSAEQHGPHLPVSTDTDIAREVARAVSEKNGYLLMPALPYGVSYEHAPLFQASVKPQLLCDVILEVCASLCACGIRDVVVINGHHGNIEALDMLSERRGSGGDDGGSGGGGGRDKAGPEDAKRQGPFPRMRVFHYWRHMDSELGHAGFAETSMMLAISPDAVRMDRAQRGLITDGMSPDKVREISALAQKSFPEATGNGVWGDPRGATAQAGRLLLDEAASGIARDCLGDDVSGSSQSSRSAAGSDARR